MKTLTDWLAHLETSSTIRSNNPLTRIAYLIDALQLRRLAENVIIVSGTNGKGSVIRLLESIYLQAGYTVAAISSPHLLHFTERLRCNGQAVDEGSLVLSFERMEALRNKGMEYNFFDVFHVALYDCLKRFKPDVALIEVGLGGRLDISNLLERQAVVLTTIDLDHQAYLGGTREAIGLEKAQLFRKGIPAVCGDLDVPQSVVQVAYDVEADFYLINKHFEYKVNKDTWDFNSPDMSCKALPRPPLKSQNAATTLMTIESLQTRLPVKEVALHAGLREAHLSGRFERLQEAPLVIADVAHNPQSARWLAEQLQELMPKKIHAIVGMLREKSLRATLEPLIALVSNWYCVNLESERSCRNQELSLECQALGAKSWYNFESVVDAFNNIQNESTVSKGDVIVIFGSFYTVAAAKRMFRRS